MLAGRAFGVDRRRDDDRDLKDDPPDVSASAAIPLSLVSFLRRCLDKRPERFLTHDLALASGRERQLGRACSRVVSPTAAARRLASALSARYCRRVVGSSHSAIPEIRRLTFRNGNVLAALRPGRKTVVCRAPGRQAPGLFSTQIDSQESRPLGFVGTEIWRLSRARWRSPSTPRGNLMLEGGTLARVGLAGECRVRSSRALRWRTGRPTAPSSLSSGS
jgi:hypothetical protein